MAWTTPRTWSVGEVPTASNFNTHLRDNLSYLYTNRVSGEVASDGTVNVGSRFTSVKNSTGDYTVTFSVAMSTTACVAAVAAVGSTSLSPTITALSTTAFTIQWRNSSSTLTDTYFSFVAIAAE